MMERKGILFWYLKNLSKCFSNVSVNRNKKKAKTFVISALS